MENMRWRILYRVAAASKLRCCRLFLPNNAATPSRSHCRTSALADSASVGRPAKLVQHRFSTAVSTGRFLRRCPSTGPGSRQAACRLPTGTQDPDIGCPRVDIEIGRHDREVTVLVGGTFGQVVRRDVLASAGGS